jgi:hypothetical protein
MLCARMRPTRVGRRPLAKTRCSRVCVQACAENSKAKEQEQKEVKTLLDRYPLLSPDVPSVCTRAVGQVQAKSALCPCACA